MTSERRLPAEIGNAYGDVDRGNGELTVWPSVPVDEVVRMYRQKHSGAAQGGRGLAGRRPSGHRPGQHCGLHVRRPGERLVALGRHLVEVFGQEGVRRHDADDVAESQLPEAAKSTLTWAGLPADLPLFFTADRPDAPVAGDLFTDVATNLRERRSPADEEKIGALSYLTRVGFEGHRRDRHRPQLPDRGGHRAVPQAAPVVTDRCA